MASLTVITLLRKTKIKNLQKINAQTISVEVTILIHSRTKNILRTFTDFNAFRYKLRLLK